MWSAVEIHVNSDTLQSNVTFSLIYTENVTSPQIAYIFSIVALSGNITALFWKDIPSPHSPHIVTLDISLFLRIRLK